MQDLYLDYPSRAKPLPRKTCQRKVRVLGRINGLTKMKVRKRKSLQLRNRLTFRESETQLRRKTPLQRKSRCVELIDLWLKPSEAALEENQVAEAMRVCHQCVSSQSN